MLLKLTTHVCSVGGAGGKTVEFPHWALNPKGNPDYCMDTSCIHGGPDC
jgi:hypothetical protein